MSVWLSLVERWMHTPMMGCRQATRGRRSRSEVLTPMPIWVAIGTPSGLMIAEVAHRAVVGGPVLRLLHRVCHGQ
jgi:hypothetical protein